MANIRRARRSGSTIRGGRSVRESLWLGSTETQTTLASSNSVTLINVLNAGALALTPFTVVRVRGYLHVRSDQSIATEAFSAAVGMCVVSVQASAIGVTAVPTPFTDLGSDLWMVHQMLSSQFLFKAGDGVEGANGFSVEYDSRAMRKVE